MKDIHPRKKETGSVLNEVTEELSKWISEHLAERDSKNKLNSPIYHYTDSFGLDGIIKNQEVWFTSYKHLNDPTEIQYGISIASEVLSEVSKDEDKTVRFLCDTVAEVISGEEIRNRFSYFIASFSRDRDDLGQWRGYGDNGRGFAIGFAPHLFHADNNKENNSNDFAVFPVVYGRENGRHICLPIIEKAVEIFKETVKEHRNLLVDPTASIPFLRDMATNVASSAGIISSVMIKHQAYENEKEVRLVSIRSGDVIDPDIITRPRRGDIVPFIKFKIDIQKTESIPEIVVGPSASQSAENGVRTLLRSFHKNADSIVVRSEIPFRSF